MPTARPRRIAVAGASGFVGRPLTRALVAHGHEVVALTRHAADYPGAGTPVSADVTELQPCIDAMRDCSIAYYLVHSLDQGGFERQDALAAQTFGMAAHEAGVKRIVYLGGLGDDTDDLSRHLRSRHEVEGLLAADGVPVTSLRAGIVIGDQGASWEIIRAMTDLLPMLAVPTWAYTLTQPIALDDVVRYLVGVLDADPGLEDVASHVYEVGGAEVLRYVDLLSRVSAIRGRPGVIVPVPVPVPARRLAAKAAARVLPVLTGVDGRTIGTLLESMSNEVVVRDDRIRDVVDLDPVDYDTAVRTALTARERRRRAA